MFVYREYVGVLQHTSLPDVPVPSGGASGACCFSVYVLATSEPGTRAALRAAKRYAAGLDARVVIVAPLVVPYPADVEDSEHPAAVRAEWLRRTADALGLNAHVVSVICRSYRDTPKALPREALVLVGGVARRWWRTREQRLAARLTKAGCRALFVPHTP
jgi:hypothetical protein